MMKQLIAAVAAIGMMSGAALADVEVEEDDGVLEETGEVLGSAVEETGDAVGEVAEETGEGVGELGEGIEEGLADEDADLDDDEIEVEG